MDQCMYVFMHECIGVCETSLLVYVGDTIHEQTLRIMDRASLIFSLACRHASNPFERADVADWTERSSPVGRPLTDPVDWYQ